MSDFSDLDSLLTESVALRDKAATAKKAQAAQARGFSGYSPKEAQEANAIVANWDREQNWIPVQDIAVYHAYTCDCGNRTVIFHRFMQRQDHKRTSARRWETVEEISESLPRASAFQEFTTTMCTACAHEYEFEEEKALPLQEFFDSAELICGEVVEDSEAEIDTARPIEEDTMAMEATLEGTYFPARFMEVV